MKIALLSSWYWEESHLHYENEDGGSAQQLAEAVAALGHEVIVLSQSPEVRKLRQYPIGKLQTWVSPRGNLPCSVLEVLDVAPAIAATLGFAAGLATEAALRQVSLEAALRAGPESFKYELKWPNDVLVGGRKLVGISLDAEAVDEHLAVVAGIGINVAAAPEGTPTPAIAGLPCSTSMWSSLLSVSKSPTWRRRRVPRHRRVRRAPRAVP